jgi:hypothetical protein
MAAKSGIFDFVFKSGAKAAKEMTKGTKPAQRGVGAMPKKATPAKPTPPGRFGPNVKVLPGNGPKRGPMGRMDKYMDETGRPAMINATPLAKKAVPAKKMAPAKRTPAELAQMGKAAGAAKAARMQKLKAEKAPVPPRGAIPVKKAQPGRVSPETARKLAVMNKNKTYTQRRDAVRMLPAKPPVKKFR